MDYLKYLKKCENECKSEIDKIDEIALYNQQKILNAFHKNNINSTSFNPSTGYGYDDVSRNKLCKLYASIFNTEDAIVSPLIVNGTHALSLCLFGILRPNDTVLSISGIYDTLEEAINGKSIGSLKDYNINYKSINIINDDDSINYNLLKDSILNCLSSLKILYIQRSKGYLWRNTISIENLSKIIDFCKKLSQKTIIMVDNCYGEFVDKYEPTDIGADLIAGSLIKNPGGGIAPTGGYICGRKDLINLISYRFTVPGLGMEVGSYNSSYLPFYQGIFLAPSHVANSLKGSILLGYALKPFNLEFKPEIGTMPTDIIKSIKFNNEEDMIKFIQLIQKISPVESNVIPEPWDMPGYENKVIMAAGTFVQGASLELSADGPIKNPYIAYYQGGLTYEHCKLAIIEIIKYFIDKYPSTLL